LERWFIPRYNGVEIEDTFAEMFPIVETSPIVHSSFLCPKSQCMHAKEVTLTLPTSTRFKAMCVG